MIADPAYWRIANAISDESIVDREHHARTIWITVQKARQHIRRRRR
jgi:hypothetical protein